MGGSRYVILVVRAGHDFERTFRGLDKKALTLLVAQLGPLNTDVVAIFLRLDIVAQGVEVDCFLIDAHGVAFPAIDKRSGRAASKVAQLFEALGHLDHRPNGWNFRAACGIKALFIMDLTIRIDDITLSKITVVIQLRRDLYGGELRLGLVHRDRYGAAPEVGFSPAGHTVKPAIFAVIIHWSAPEIRIHARKHLALVRGQEAGTVVVRIGEEIDAVLGKFRPLSQFLVEDEVQALVADGNVLLVFLNVVLEFSREGDLETVLVDLVELELLEGDAVASLAPEAHIGLELGLQFEVVESGAVFQDSLALRDDFIEVRDLEAGLGLWPKLPIQCVLSLAVFQSQRLTVLKDGEAELVVGQGCERELVRDIYRSSLRLVIAEKYALLDVFQLLVGVMHVPVRGDKAIVHEVIEVVVLVHGPVPAVGQIVCTARGDFRAIGRVGRSRGSLTLGQGPKGALVDPVPDKTAHGVGILAPQIPILFVIAQGVTHGMGIFDLQVWAGVRVLQDFFVVAGDAFEYRVANTVFAGRPVHAAANVADPFTWVTLQDDGPLLVPLLDVLVHQAEGVVVIYGRFSEENTLVTIGPGDDGRKILVALKHVGTAVNGGVAEGLHRHRDAAQTAGGVGLHIGLVHDHETIAVGQNIKVDIIRIV